MCAHNVWFGRDPRVLALSLRWDALEANKSAEMVGCELRGVDLRHKPAVDMIERCLFVYIPFDRRDAALWTYICVYCYYMHSSSSAY